MTKRNVGQKFEFSEEEVTGCQSSGGSSSISDSGFFFGGDERRPAGLYGLDGKYYGGGNSFDVFNLLLDDFKKVGDAYFVAAARCACVCPGAIQAGNEMNQNLASLTNSLTKVF